MAPTCLTASSPVAAYTIHCIILRVSRAFQFNPLFNTCEAQRNLLCISFVYEYAVHTNTDDVHRGELYCKEEIVREM